jgi:hypothetical protein
MVIDLTSRGDRQLEPWEVSWLVTGVKATDSYADPILIIRGHRLVVSQIKLLTRWGGGWNLTGGVRDGIAEFEEVT